jgi:hypothetical protein
MDRSVHKQGQTAKEIPAADRKVLRTGGVAAAVFRLAKTDRVWTT